eukprot:scaffold211_cov52-Phaeocystis_antarctica.AAC.1
MKLDAADSKAGGGWHGGAGQSSHPDPGKDAWQVWLKGTQGRGLQSRPGGSRRIYLSCVIGGEISLDISHTAVPADIIVPQVRCHFFSLQPVAEPVGGRRSLRARTLAPPLAVAATAEDAQGTGRSDLGQDPWQV